MARSRSASDTPFSSSSTFSPSLADHATRLHAPQPTEHVRVAPACRTPLLPHHAGARLSTCVASLSPLLPSLTGSSQRNERLRRSRLVPSVVVSASASSVRFVGRHACLANCPCAATHISYRIGKQPMLLPVGRRYVLRCRRNPAISPYAFHARSRRARHEREKLSHRASDDSAAA